MEKKPLKLYKKENLILFLIQMPKKMVLKQLKIRKLSHSEKPIIAFDCWIFIEEKENV
jgi:hypothetical protein